jgi:ABC-type multidrug transport system ATPase subunit
LTGPNGSGKSTLLRCIAGSMKPSGGTITVCDQAAGSVAARDLVGVSLSQERSFFLRLTGEQNLTYFAKLRRDRPAGAKDHVRAIIQELELADVARQRVDRCSTGMIQQLTFARALLGDPHILLLDEPTRSLDKNAIERLWAALDRRPGCLVLIATHLEDDVARCGARIDLTEPR